MVESKLREGSAPRVEQYSITPGGWDLQPRGSNKEDEEYVFDAAGYLETILRLAEEDAKRAVWGKDGKVEAEAKLAKAKKLYLEEVNLWEEVKAARDEVLQAVRDSQSSEWAPNLWDKQALWDLEDKRREEAVVVVDLMGPTPSPTNPAGSESPNSSLSPGPALPSPALPAATTLPPSSGL